MAKKLQFGDHVVWKKPASEFEKAKRIPAVVLEELDNGCVYLFLYNKETNLTGRTATTLGHTDLIY